MLGIVVAVIIVGVAAWLPHVGISPRTAITEISPKTPVTGSTELSESIGISSTVKTTKIPTNSTVSQVTPFNSTGNLHPFATQNATMPTNATVTNATVTMPSPEKHNKLHFIFIAWESQYSHSLPILQKYLVVGDSVFLQTNNPGIDASYKSNFFANGVNVYLMKRTYGIQDIISNSASWPAGYDLWEYDYEKGNNYEPQFTPDQAQSEKFFDQARQYLNQYNQRTSGHCILYITPSYPQVNGQNWNWLEAQQHADLMDVQIQRWQETDPQLSVTAAQHVAESATSWIAQSSLSGQHTVSGALNLINATSGLVGIKSYLIFYGGNYDGLQSFLQQVR